MLLRTCWNCD